jgi:hypothetical protein
VDRGPDVPGPSPDDALSAAAFGRAFRTFLEQSVGREEATEPPFVARLREHLGVDPRELPIVSESFSTIEHPNLQAALDAWISAPGRSAELVGISAEHKRFQSLGFSDLVTPASGGLMGDRSPRPGPVDYVNAAIGREEVRACVQHGLYLLRGEGDDSDGSPLAVLVRGPGEHGGMPQIQTEVMTPDPTAATGFLEEIRASMRRHNVYRGKVLSLGNPHGPFGYGAPGVEFPLLPDISREEVVLPEGVLEGIERHTVGFSRHAGRLLAAGRHLKRGLLLYGPPGTGKTLTAMYLIGQMPGRTVLLLSGNSYGLISPTCELARNLQPSMVILEDVDLVAEERGMSPFGENPLLFELLNEMDGLASDADVIFMLTTNRPDLLEPALAARPGRIDGATEIPLPDAACRRRLLQLYGRGMELRLGDEETVISRTEGTSAALLKELLRRAALLAAEESGDESGLVVTDRHMQTALDELLQNPLISQLLGGERRG